jgi:hypothetical protein
MRSGFRPLRTLYPSTFQAFCGVEAVSTLYQGRGFGGLEPAENLKGRGVEGSGRSDDDDYLWQDVPEGVELTETESIMVRQCPDGHLRARLKPGACRTLRLRSPRSRS